MLSSSRSMGAAQLIPNGKMTVSRLGHARPVEQNGIFSVGLGPAQRGVGVLEQLIRIVAVVREQAYTDGQRHEIFVAVNFEGFFQRVHEPLGLLLDGCTRKSLGYQDVEFVAADTRNHNVSAHGGAHPAGGRRENFISAGMPSPVVDELEIVKVYIKDTGKSPRRSGVFERLTKALTEPQAVGKTGECVVGEPDTEAER